MTNADLDRLEHVRGIRLPDDYRATMLAYPFPPDHEAAAFDLPPDIDTILALQLEPDEAEGPDGPWPRHYVVIGSDGGEEAYVLDVSREPAPVLAYYFETGERRTLAPNVQSFVESLRRRPSGGRASGTASAPADRRRPWWRIWPFR